MVCSLHKKITRNLSTERSEPNATSPTLIFGFRFTRNLPSNQLQGLWFIAAVTMMSADHQTECVLQWLLASVGSFALFLQTLCLLSFTEFLAFSFSGSVLWYTFKLSVPHKGISSHCEVTHNKQNVITFGYTSRYEALFHYFHFNIHCYLFVLLSGHCFINSICLSLRFRQSFGGGISH